MKPILIDFPEQLTTERLLIRKPMPGDGKAVYDAMQASLTELKEYMPWAHRNQTVEDVEVNMREAHAKFLTREDLRLHLYDKETREFIGSSGLHRINWSVPKFEIGYWIDTRHSGKGYITEATHAITEFAFTELKARRVEIRCDSNNSKSRAIPEKLGFTLEGILKNDGLSADGIEIRDTCVYAKTK
ncbi:RimJ/RimL family protein N-acetyltransferase [Bacillus sp. SORGH_AS 510]|uniref:GNAT family N-acetyltransferase n=1 Tax=Bacillus sp. SORGH_AS_0510 TaxID=3041771 RepID=UPI002784B83F|nr:GNAT family N-acetyltransferase [Bacillus sp. SORGH_AS_0510]MDQ1146442.1 RimJ/RimL family protein N-acetyltransferase [Bacillus sp. SORGH_AS_0510]